MAGRKEYEMLFALNARMNGGFSGTFSKAQAEFTRLGKEIQGLHRIQGDIASYQKQEKAIDATRSRLESLQKQHDLLQKEISETSGSAAGLERESVKLEQRIKDTETALERQNQKLEHTGAKLKEAGVDTKNLAQKDTELTARIKELGEITKFTAKEAGDAMGSPSYSGSVPTARRITGRGYAGGTRNAEPGWAMVGEEDPEALFFGGGEVVLNARQTAALLAKPVPAVSALPEPGERAGSTLPPWKGAAMG